jgi:hypothetical protein
MAVVFHLDTSRGHHIALPPLCRMWAAILLPTAGNRDLNDDDNDAIRKVWGA